MPAHGSVVGASGMDVLSAGPVAGLVDSVTDPPGAGKRPEAVEALGCARRRAPGDAPRGGFP